ncbi:MAG TPA: hypothetical protein PKH07_18740, partial [bacterium]|nr:hypothetical protein [bacterium]
MSLRTRVRRFTESALELARMDSVDQMCCRAVELARSDLGFERCGLFLRSRNDPNLFEGTYGTNAQGEIRDEHHLQYDIRNDEKLAEIVENRQKYPILSKGISCGDGEGIEKTADHAAHLIWGGNQNLGIIFTDTLLTGRSLTEEDMDMLMLYSSTVGHLIGTLQTHESLRTQNRQLQAFRAVAETIVSSSSTEDLAERLSEIIRSLLPCDTFFLNLYDPVVDSIIPVYHWNRSTDVPESVKGMMFSAALTSAIRSLLTTRQPLVLFRSEDHQDFLQESIPSYSSQIYLPLLSAAKAAGYFSVQTDTPQAYSVEDINML